MCWHHLSGGEKQDVVYYQLTCHCQNYKLHALPSCFFPHHSVCGFSSWGTLFAFFRVIAKKKRNTLRSHQLLPLKKKRCHQTDLTVQSSSLKWKFSPFSCVLLCFYYFSSALSSDFMYFFLFSSSIFCFVYIFIYLFSVKIQKQKDSWHSHHP